MPEKKEFPQEQKVSREEALRALVDEVAKDIAPIEESDPETAEFLRSIQIDNGITTFDFLRWVDLMNNPSNVLYPASGFNKIPKLAFGESRVVHTGLDMYDSNEPEATYFQQLGEGKKVVADNRNLPFRAGAFQAICILDSPQQILGNYKEYARVLEKGGLVIFSNTLLLDSEEGRIIPFLENPAFKKVEVPDEFQQKGDSNTKFFVFRKKP